MVGWALLVAIAGILYFLDPTESGTSSVRRALDGPGPLALLDEAWSIVYAVGGLATAFGVAKERATFARPGLALLLGALGLNIAAIFSVRGAVDGLISAPPFVVAMTIFGLYLRYLEHERQTVLAASRLLDLEARHDRRRVPR